MKTVLVTGAARGIGRVIAEDFAQDHHVAFTWHKSPADTARAAMPSALAVQADLTREDSGARVIAQTLEHFGQVDVIVNNAGIIAPSPMDNVEYDQHHAMMDMHLSAPAALLAAALPHLKPGAAIINISSINATLPPMGAAIYGASKAAQDLWTKGMAKELGPKGIRVNAVAPGAINIAEAPRDETLTQAFVDLTAMGRLATAQDISDAVRFLASDKARSITGQILQVSAGYRL